MHTLGSICYLLLFHSYSQQLQLVETDIDACEIFQRPLDRFILIKISSNGVTATLRHITDT